MVDKHSITTPIEAIVKDEISKITFPNIVVVTKIYNDYYVDVESESFGTLRHIYSITEHEINDKTLLIFADNDFNQRIVI